VVCYVLVPWAEACLCNQPVEHLASCPPIPWELDFGDFQIIGVRPQTQFNVVSLYLLLGSFEKERPSCILDMKREPFVF